MDSGNGIGEAHICGHAEDLPASFVPENVNTIETIVPGSKLGRIKGQAAPLRCFSETGFGASGREERIAESVDKEADKGSDYHEQREASGSFAVRKTEGMGRFNDEEQNAERVERHGRETGPTPPESGSNYNRERPQGKFGDTAQAQDRERSGHPRQPVRQCRPCHTSSVGRV